MEWADAVNAGFEFGASLAIFNHCRLLYRAKCVAGVSTLSTAFFTLWGFWNLYFYPSLNQYASFAAGISIVVMNIIWLGLMVHYRAPHG